MGIAFMVADSTLKHYSQDQSSVKINSYLIVHTLVGDVSEKVADAVMKNQELNTKIYNSSDPLYEIAAAIFLSGEKDR